MKTIHRTSAYALILAEGHVLLSKIARGSSAGKWSLVGGGIEPGETALEALVREVKEEAAIEIEPEQATFLAELDLESIYRNQNGETGPLKMKGFVHRVDLPKMITCKDDTDGLSSAGCEWVRIEDVTTENTNSFVTRALALAAK